MTYFKINTPLSATTPKRHLITCLYLCITDP